MKPQEAGRVTEDMLRQLQSGCVDMLEALRHPSAAERAKRMIKALLGRSGAGESDPLFWPAGFLLLGLVESAAAGVHFEENPAGKAGAWFADWLRKDGRIRHVDDALAGVAALGLCRMRAAADGETYSREEASAAREAACRTFRFLQKAPKDAAGSLIDQPSEQNRGVYADGTGMTAMFLSSYAAFRDPLTGEGLPDAEAAREMARIQLANYMMHGMDASTGLPYHGYCLLENGMVEKRGLVGWGRATGFLMMGFAAYLTAFEDAKLRDRFFGLKDDALAFQRQDGLFSWQLPAAEGHVDTSASAMIGWALRTAGRSELLPADADRLQTDGAVGRMEGGLLSRMKDGRMEDALAECVDFAQHPQRYGVYPWGMGAALLFFTEGVSVKFL